jgi:TolB-like protein
MKEVLELQKYSIACSSTECAVEAGQLLGVEYMIYGSIGRIGSMFTVNVYVTSVEKGAVVAAATVDLSGQIEGLLTEGMRQAVNKLLQAVIEKGDK